MGHVYDIAVIGAGPAGMTAALYACRARMETVLIEHMACGGQILTADRIENFPGFPEGICGPELAGHMFKQAEHFGVELRSAEAKAIVLKKNEKGPFAVNLDNSEGLSTVSIIVATGARWNLLNIPGEKELTGRGVSYCATCDGPLFKGKDVVVVGGGDSALEEALFLTRFANKVTIIHRRDRLRAARILQERASADKRIEFCLNAVATKIAGTKKVEAIVVKDAGTNEERTIAADGVFVLIGIRPNTEIVKGIVELDEKGYVVSDAEMRTSIDGIFACGDVRKKALRQVATAVGDGATAAFTAGHYCDRLKGVEYK